MAADGTVPWGEFDSSACSIARTMAWLGQPWTVLVVRDLFNGVHRFDELAEHLGIARNVLAKRLDSLVEAGLVRKEDYREPGRRTRKKYLLTEAGWDLRPVLIALMAFGDAHFSDPRGVPARVEHAGCGGEVSVRPVCSESHDLARDAAVRVVPGPGAEHHR